MLEKIALFSSARDFFLFLSLCLCIFSYSLLIEYNNYKNLTQFDSALVYATILKQYSKTKIRKNVSKTYQVLKLKSSQGFHFYTTAKQSFPYSKGKKVRLEIWAGKINFYAYMNSFFAFSKLLEIQETQTLKQRLNTSLSELHHHTDIESIYKALYTATPLHKELQSTFSALGISHLFAISGFHLGVLCTLLFLLLKTPYTFLQNRYFPYRSYTRDSFCIISLTLLLYLLFLDSPPSLLRAYVMFLVGFFLYDRAFKVISMWTLLLTATLILSFAPRLCFALGFWLSIAGVFYIFLFLLYFKDKSKIFQWFCIPVWVYVMMLPYSLFLFETFSLLHPISIILTALFTFFYPLSILLHLVGFGSFFDTSLLWILNIDLDAQTHTLPLSTILVFVSLSLASISKRIFLYPLCCLALFILINSVYHVA